MRLFITAIVFLFTLNLHAQYAGVELDPLRAIDSIYIPAGSATTPGNGVFTGPLANTARTYQLLIHQSELTALLGKELKGLSVRQPGSATTTWPAADVLYSDYDIYVSQGVAPADRSFTFALNVIGPQTLVHSGTLTIPTGVYPFGGTPNYCGDEIPFTIPWVYSGSHMLIEFRHNGSNGTSRSVDAFTTSSPGYGTQFSAAWGSGYTATTGSQGNFSIIKLTFDDPIPVELTSFSGRTIDNDVELNWSTATESNNRGFQIETIANGNWISLGFVEGGGTTTEPKLYSFVVRNVNPGTHSYRLKQIDYDGAFSYSDVIEIVVNAPGEFSLKQNFPNPFNPATKIEYSVPVESKIILSVYDLLGNEIAVLVNEQKPAGTFEVTWNAGSYPSGIYFCKLQSGAFVQTRKMMLLR